MKEVSLDLHSDSSLAQYISLAAQRNEIVSALAGYGIAVRPNAPVALAVTVTDHRPVVEYRDVKTQVVQETIVVHGIYISLRFFVKAAALRNGKLHLVWAAPETSFSGRSRAEDNSTRKLFAGRFDATGQSKDVCERSRRLPEGPRSPRPAGADITPGDSSGGGAATGASPGRNAMGREFLDGEGQGSRGRRVRADHEPGYTG